MTQLYSEEEVLFYLLSPHAGICCMGKLLTTHIPTLQNPTDLLTKVLYSVKRQTHVRNILYDIYYNH